MSSEGLAWAFKQTVPSSSAKFVLVAMAECANYKTGHIHPSLDHLGEITALNRKTIIAAVEWLLANGYVLDTGERAGRTKQIKVFVLNLERVPDSEQSQKRNSSDFSGKQSQKRDTEPSREPSPQKVSPSSGRATRLPSDWMPPTVLPAELAAMVAQWPPGHLDRTLADFRDYWTAASGSNARKSDWPATWRRWLRRADDDLAKHRNRNVQRPGPFERGSGWAPSIASGFDRDGRDELLLASNRRPPL